MSDAPQVGTGTGLPLHVQAKAKWRAYKSTATAAGADVSVGVSASFTADALLAMLGSSLLDAGMQPNLLLGQYGQVFQTCFDHRSQFDGVDPDVIVLLWRIEDILAPEFWNFVTGVPEALSAARDRVDELARSVAHLRSAFKGTIVVSVPPYPQGTTADLLELDNVNNAGAFHRAILDYSVERIGAAGQIRFLDLDALQRQVGVSNCFDARKWYLYKQPYTEAFLLEIGHLLARLIKAGRVAPRKCLVVDADNTLWGGIVGEDGVGGLEIGEDFPGSAYRDLQKYMLYLRSRGVMLAVVSKNNEPDVWEVFDGHDGMKLKRDHLSAWQINWLPKGDNIAQIAKDLNIGVDSLVFVDDNPFEIEQVQKAVPSVGCVQLPEEPAQILGTLKGIRLFDKLSVTDEDARRADMMKSEQARTRQSTGVSHEEFVRSLQLKVELGEARDSHLGRVAQLINKTNQFNLTTVRRTQEEVEALAASPDWKVYSYRVADKFGDYGLVGVAIIEIVSSSRWRLDTLLLSCRVLGRSVESAFVAGLAQHALADGIRTLDAVFIPTSKNALAADYLETHGFMRIDATGWRAEVGRIPSNPEFIDLVVDAKHKATEFAQETR